MLRHNPSIQSSHSVTAWFLRVASYPYLLLQSQEVVTVWPPLGQRKVWARVTGDVLHILPNSTQAITCYKCRRQTFPVVCRISGSSVHLYRRERWNSAPCHQGETNPQLLCYCCKTCRACWNLSTPKQSDSWSRMLLSWKICKSESCSVLGISTQTSEVTDGGPE